MLGTWNTKDRTVAIVGGGISGLLAGYYLKKKGVKVTIYEKTNRVGGLINTYYNDCGMIQQGPHLTRTTPVFDALCQDLKIPCQNVKSTKRYFYINQKTKRLPLSFLDILNIIFRIFCIKKKYDSYDNSLTFFKYHFGKGYILFKAMARGIYGCCLKELDPKIAFQSFYPSKGKTIINTIIKFRQKNPPQKIIAPIGGFGLLVEKLTDFLEADIQLNRDITDLNTLSQTNKVLATPTFVTAKLLPLGQTATLLAQIPYSAISTLTVFLDRRSLSKKPKGIGILTIDHLQILGVLYNSASFDGRTYSIDIESFTLMLKLDTPNQIAIDFIKNLYGPKSIVLKAIRCDFPKGIPVYGKALRNFLDNYILPQGYILCGNYIESASISKMAQNISKNISQNFCF